MSAVTAGFGDALTAALDVMAFAHEFDLSTATEGIPTNIDARQTKTIPKAAPDHQPAKTTGNNPETTTTTTSLQSHKQLIQMEETRLSALTDLIDKPIDPVNVKAMNLKNANRKLIMNSIFSL